VSHPNHPLQPLIDQLKRLPGVGGKSAQRLAFHFISLPMSEIKKISEILLYTKENIKYCSVCFNISFLDTCTICNDPIRETKRLCVVADPKDILAIERARVFNGRYHVLGGLISPIDGLHPEMLRLSELVERVKKDQFEEIILAINPSVEGDATVLYITSLLKSFSVQLTRLAFGLPMGAELDYTDEITIQKALLGRTKI